jgi:DNA polymerase-1
MVLKRFFLNKNIKKIAHNLKFEDLWLSFFLKMEIKNWWFDTIIAAHIIDNRSGITGLKDQTYFNFGIAGYDDDIAPFLKSKNKGGNEINRIKEADMNQVLLYNGLDSLYTYRLYKKQIQEMSATDFEAYNFFHEATLAFCDIEKTGVCADMSYYYKREKILTKKIDRYYDDIMQSKEIALWEKNKPEKIKKKHEKKWEHFNLNSTQQKAYLFFDLLGFESSKKTATGNNSTDIEALEGIDNDFIQKISKRKKLLTLRDTHLAGFIREECDGKIHTSYNLNTVVTYRGSSSGPNLQNVPVRDKLANSTCRGGLVPSSGNEIVSIDYGGIEVKVSACNHRDPAMLAECFEPDKYDMHRDMAAELFLMDREEVSKDARFFAKNNFVFAQFYGDYYVNCARNLWKNIDEKIMDHLRKKGIKSYNQFEKIVQDVEYRFWQERFKVYYKWKERTWKKYLNEGKIELLSGFVCRGHMRKNEILNYGIQGPAFHILLWSLIQVNKFLKKEKTKTKVIGQIHDEMLLDVCPKEKKYLKPIVKKIMTVDVKEAFPWIITPLVLDMEVSGVGGNWASMKEEKI